MKLLVGIPAFNKPKSIKKSIQSLLNQTCKTFDILISDDSDPEVATVIAAHIESLKTDRIKYIKNNPKLGLFPNMSFLWEEADDNNYDFFMWLCDDDEIMDKYFIEDAMKIFDRHNNCAVVGYKCDRFLNDEFWYSYKDISTLKLGKIKRLNLMLQAWREDANQFETMQYGIHKMALCPKNFTIGYRKSIITFFITIAFKSSIHTIGRCRSKKNTDEEHLKRYKKKKEGINEHHYDQPLFFKYLHGGIFVRVRILYNAAIHGGLLLLPYIAVRLFR